jgi:hypothetical protein
MMEGSMTNIHLSLMVRVPMPFNSALALFIALKSHMDVRFDALIGASTLLRRMEGGRGDRNHA